jgi:membrane protein YqaA with SNARE-associated domain
MKDGVFFTNLPYYIGGLIKQFSHLLPEIIFVAILACVSGGLAGKYLARIIKGNRVEVG